MKIYIILLIVLECIFLLIGCTLLYIHHRKRKNCTESTKATVVEMKRVVHRNSDGHYRTVWQPVVEYYVEGQLIHQISSLGSNPPRYKVGDSIAIKYDSKKPTNFLIEGDNLTLIIGIIFIIISLILLFITPLILRMIFKV
ncbi:MAG: DUF3592 domain-containing protein [Lachnospiraceae bacterium]|nr:DUF3592 domain-containing protein [Lachnospiraceae bacterium]